MASPSPFIPLAPDTFSGRKLGKYEIVCRLSTGGMSEIFLAFQRGVGGFRKWVVLKQILPDIKGEEEFVRMFLDEAKITAAFNHPNIAHVFDLDIADGELFLSMEFVPGATLVEIARMCRLNSEPIPIGMTLQSVRDTALALHYAHNFTDPLGQPQPVIHRDIAEKNIMVTYEGTTKLLDFGIAKSHANSGRTMVGMVKGTSGYMSPEQILGEKLDGRSDVFSLGVVLHECLTGMRLFHAKTPEQGMLAPLRETVNPPSKQNPLVTPEIDAVVLKSLKRTREERHSSALEFARDLEAAAGPLIWRPEQTAPFVQRLFTERREQTRQLLSNASMANAAAEHTGEIRLKAFLQGDPPPRPSLSRQPPVPPQLPEMVESDESTDPLRDKNLISLPQRRQSLPEIPRAKPNLRAHTEEVTNPNGPPAKNAQRDFESTAPIIKPPPPTYDSFSEPSEEEPEAQTILNRPNELLQFLDPSVKAKLPQYDAEDMEPPPVEEEQAPEDDEANTEWDRDADDAEEDDAEIRTIVQPPARPRGDTDTGEHDTVSAVAQPKSSKKWIAVALVLVAAGGAGVAWKLGYLGKGGGEMIPVTEKPIDLQPKKTPPVEKKQEAKKEAPKVEEKVVAVPVENARPDSGLAAAQQTQQLAIEAKKEEPKLPPVEEKKETPPPVIEKIVEAKKEPPPVEKKKQTVRKVVAKVEKKEAPPPVEKAEPNATGQLTLVTTPWAKVQFKSQDLGVTPLFKVQLPVGKHTLKLTGPDNQVIMLPVEIKDGQVTTLRQKLADLAP